MTPWRHRAAPWPLAVVAIVGILVTARAEAACRMRPLLELPVTMVGARPAVPVWINGVEGQFLIDSGAFYSMIAPSALARFGLSGALVPRGQVGGVGGRVAAQSTVAEDMALGGFAFHHVPFLAVEGAGAGLSGLLGQNVLGVADVEYDLAHGVVRLIRPEGCGADMPTHWSGGRVRSLDLLPWSSALNRRTQAYGELNGHKIRLIFDTGAARSIMTLETAARAGVTPLSRGVTFAGRSRGIGQDSIDTWMGSFDRFAIGGEVVQPVRIAFGGLEVGDTDMLLGADFFLGHRVYVDNGRHKLYFTNNADSPASLDAPLAAAPPADGAGREPPSASHAPSAEPTSDQTIADLGKRPDIGP
jgi:predicted aspartyl protease